MAMILEGCARRLNCRNVNPMNREDDQESLNEPPPWMSDHAQALRRARRSGALKSGPIIKEGRIIPLSLKKLSPNSSRDEFVDKWENG